MGPNTRSDQNKCHRIENATLVKAYNSTTDNTIKREIIKFNLSKDNAFHGSNNKEHTAMERAFRKGEATATQYNRKAEMLLTAMSNLNHYRDDYSQQTAVHILNTLKAESKTHMKVVADLKKSSFSSPAIKEVIDEARQNDDPAADDAKAKLLAKLAAAQQRKKTAKTRGRAHTAKVKAEDRELRKETGKGMSDLRGAIVEAQAAEKVAVRAAEASRTAAAGLRAADEKLGHAKVHEESARAHETKLVERYLIERHRTEGHRADMRTRGAGGGGGGGTWSPFNGFIREAPASPSSSSRGGSGSRAGSGWDHYRTHVAPGGQSRAELSAGYAEWKAAK